MMLDKFDGHHLIKPILKTNDLIELKQTEYFRLIDLTQVEWVGLYKLVASTQELFIVMFLSTNENL